jgi:hypothetical protein
MYSEVVLQLTWIAHLASHEDHTPRDGVKQNDPSYACVGAIIERLDELLSA